MVYREITNGKILHVDILHDGIYNQQYDIWVCPNIVLYHQQIQCNTEHDDNHWIVGVPIFGTWLEWGYFWEPLGSQKYEKHIDFVTVI